MVDFWALPRLIWLWLFFILFFLEKKNQFRSSKALEQTLVLHFLATL